MKENVQVSNREIFGNQKRKPRPLALNQCDSILHFLFAFARAPRTPIAKLTKQTQRHQQKVTAQEVKKAIR